LADIQVFVTVDTYIVAMLEDGLVLDHELKFTSLVHRFCPARIGDYFVLSIQNGYKPGVGCEVQVTQA
jgi:hypothetical protein